MSTENDSDSKLNKLNRNQLRLLGYTGPGSMYDLDSDLLMEDSLGDDYILQRAWGQLELYDQKLTEAQHALREIDELIHFSKTYNKPVDMDRITALTTKYWPIVGSSGGGRNYLYIKTKTEVSLMDSSEVK